MAKENKSKGGWTRVKDMDLSVPDRVVNETTRFTTTATALHVYRRTLLLGRLMRRPLR